MFKYSTDSHRRSIAALAAALLAAAWLVAAPAMAADAASAEAASAKPAPPIRIEADHAQLDDREGVSVYTGDVRVARGALTITGQRLVITRRDPSGSDAANTYVAVMTGSPAHLDHGVTEEVQQPVTGTAHTIRYDTAEEVVRLEGEAELHQGRDILRGNVIRYDVPADRVIAESGESGGDRVFILIHPEAREQQ